MSKKLFKFWMMIEKYFDQTDDVTTASPYSSDQMEIKHQQLKIIRY